MNKIQTAVILAAGLGSRLKDKTRYMPKGFIEIGGISLIQRSVTKLKAAGIQNIIIGTGHHSEYYEEFAVNNQGIECKKSELYESTGSMYTLFNLRELITEDFLLLESDLLFHSNGLSELIQEDYPDVILASGKTFSGDEVYIQYNEKALLENMSKQISQLSSVDAELVGITKVSYPTYQNMCEFAESIFAEKPKIDYEYVLVEMAKNKPIFVKKMEDYVWCEIDDDSHLERALNSIFPKLDY